MPGDRKIETPLEKLDTEAHRVLADRHDRIRSELRATLATVIGVSGTVITLSLTVLDKVAPKKLHSWLLAVAWVLFASAIVVSLAVFLDMTRRSVNHQDTLGELYQAGKLNLFFHYGGGTPGGNYMHVVAEKFPGQLGTNVASIICGLGVLFSIAFAVLNLLNK